MDIDELIWLIKSNTEKANAKITAETLSLQELQIFVAAIDIVKPFLSRNSVDIIID